MLFVLWKRAPPYILWPYILGGQRLPAVEQAWGILAHTTFRSGQGVGLGHRYCSNYFPPANWDAWLTQKKQMEGLFWRGGYETDAEAATYTAQLFTAWKLLTESADECGTATARFDVADLGREWMQTVPCVAAWRALASGWKNRSLPEVGAAAAALDRSLLEMDELLSTADGFTLGAWIAAARNLSSSAAGKAQLEMNARAQVTTWTLCQPGASRECPTGFFSGIMDCESRVMLIRTIQHAQSQCQWHILRHARCLWPTLI